MAIREKGISLVVATLIAAVAVISVVSIVVFFIIPPASNEFVITVDKEVMNNWKMEPATYAGRTVTKITIGSSEMSGLYVSRLEVNARVCSATELELYATYVEGTTQGITSGWAGGDVPSEALGLLLPQENAVMENVTMRVLYQKAESMKLGGMTALSPSHDEPHTITMPYVTMYDWEITGPVPYKCPDGKTVDVTSITAGTIKAPLSLRWKNWEQTAANSIQKNVLVYSTYSRGTALGFTMSWTGGGKPPELKNTLGDPASMIDVEQLAVFIRATEIELTAVELKIL